MAKILINEQEPIALYINGEEAATVYQNGEKVWPADEPVVTDYIEFVVDASSGSFTVPLCNQNVSYSFDVFVNGSLHGRATGTANQSTGTGYQITGLTGTEATIRLIPVDEPVAGWGRAFGFYNNTAAANSQENKDKVLRLIKDPDFAHLESSVTTGNNFRYYQFLNCSNLTLIPDEDMPETVTTMGNYFRRMQFSGTGLINPAAESCPDSITSIVGNFRYQQYSGCINLQTPAVEVISTNVTTITTGFRSGQYANCSSLQSTTQEVLPNAATLIQNNFRDGQYMGTGVSSCAIEVIPNSITRIGNSFRYRQYSDCPNLVSLTDEVIPSSITGVGTYFRWRQFANCSSLSQTVNELIPDTVTSIGGYYRYEQYRDCSNIVVGSCHFYDRFPAILNANANNYRYMFYLDRAMSSPDIMPTFGTTNPAPVNDVTPTSRKNFVSNRTGITGYDELNSNWK